MAIPFFVEGRSAAGPAAIPLAMLAAVGLVDVVWAAMQAWAGKDRAEQSENLSSIERNVMIYLLLYLVFSTYAFGLRLSSATLYPPDQKAMSWVREHTPGDARFLVLTGTTSVSCDSVLEWFPALT
jgi:mannose/fructose/N-acetylgalactosamine-specific phosphotransferase system component IIC